MSNLGGNGLWQGLDKNFAQVGLGERLSPGEPGNEAPLSPWVGHSCRVLLILARAVTGFLARQIEGTASGVPLGATATRICGTHPSKIAKGGAASLCCDVKGGPASPVSQKTVL
jgi:hypothetical protein